MAEIDDIRDAIRRIHLVESKHVESVPVKETLHGQTVWDGVVEVFELQGHKLTDRLYAWVRTVEGGRKQVITVLQLFPIDSAHDAVRTAIAREHGA